MAADLTPADPTPAPAAPTLFPDPDTIAHTLARLTDDLASRDSLTPGPEVDRLFTTAVRLVTTTPPGAVRHVLDHPEVRARATLLRHLSARGESALETHWSARIAAAQHPSVELSRFPYTDNYRELVGQELALIRRHLHGGRARSVVVLGCGPLPLTATGYADGLGAPTVGVDRDPAAVAAARAFLAATSRDAVTVHAPAPSASPTLRASPDAATTRATDNATTAPGPSARRTPHAHPAPIAVVHDDAAQVPLAAHDVVVLAALVGTTTADKAGLLPSLAARMRPGALLLARSAHGLRTLLYPEVDLDSLAGFEVLDVKHPTGDVINSMIVARRV